MVFLNLARYLRLRSIIKPFAASFPYVPERHVFVYEKKGLLTNVVEAGEKIPWNQELRAIFDLRETSNTLNFIQSHTSDGAAIECSAVFIHKITNPIKAAYAVKELETSIIETVKSSVDEVISTYSSNQLMVERLDMANEILIRSNKKMAEWGVEIRSLTLQNLRLPLEYQEIFVQRARITMLIDSLSQKQHAETENEAYATRRSAESATSGIALLTNLLKKDPDAVVALQSLIELEKSSSLKQDQEADAINNANSIHIVPGMEGLSLALSLASGKSLIQDIPKSEIEALANKVGLTVDETGVVNEIKSADVSTDNVNGRDSLNTK